jgi:hypothetical protein
MTGLLIHYLEPYQLPLVQSGLSHRGLGIILSCLQKSSRQRRMTKCTKKLQSSPRIRTKA